MEKGLLIIILDSVTTLSIVRITFVQPAYSGTDNALNYYEEPQVRNIGNSIVSFLLTRLAGDMRYRLTDCEEKSYSGGDLNFTVTDTTFAACGTLPKIQINVEYNGYPKTITSFSRPPVAGVWVPPPVRGQCCQLKKDIIIFVLISTPLNELIRTLSEVEVWCNFLKLTALLLRQGIPLERDR